MYESTPPSKAPCAPATETASAIPRSLWQCISIGNFVVRASDFILSYIVIGSSVPRVSQYLKRSAPASFPAMMNSINLSSSVLDASSAFTPTVPAPAFKAEPFNCPDLYQLKVCIDIIHLVFQGWETYLALKNAHFVRIKVQHCL